MEMISVCFLLFLLQFGTVIEGYQISDVLIEEQSKKRRKIAGRFLDQSGYIAKEDEDWALKRKKRAFGKTIFDSFAGVNEWERLNSGLAKKTLSTKPVDENDIPPELRDEMHGVVMGVSDDRCDNAKSNLEVDWDGTPQSYTCYTPKILLDVRRDLNAIETCDDVPPKYIPKHYCMKDIIQYNTSLPTYGPHRPLWPIYGEYNYVPIQRWLHNIEHGSIVVLYHPCAAPYVVQQLKDIVKGCIYKHVIAAYTEVSLERPLVMIGWGCKLEMSYVEESRVKKFIKERALHGPEGKLPKRGSYDVGLIMESLPPIGSNINDTVLCP